MSLPASQTDDKGTGTMSMVLWLKWTRRYYNNYGTWILVCRRTRGWPCWRRRPSRRGSLRRMDSHRNKHPSAFIDTVFWIHIHWNPDPAKNLNPDPEDSRIRIRNTDSICLKLLLWSSKVVSSHNLAHIIFFSTYLFFKTFLSDWWMVLAGRPGEDPGAGREGRWDGRKL